MTTYVLLVRNRRMKKGSVSRNGPAASPLGRDRELVSGGPPAQAAACSQARTSAACLSGGKIG
jgi:hypothetical protein